MNGGDAREEQRVDALRHADARAPALLLGKDESSENRSPCKVNLSDVLTTLLPIVCKDHNLLVLEENIQVN